MDEFCELSLWRKVFIHLTLTALHLLNYMDRYMLNAIVLKVQNYFYMSDKDIGALSVYLFSGYMIFSFVFGFIGDRYSRKWPICGGGIIWATGTLLGPFSPRAGKYMFFFTRFLVGIGQAGICTLGSPMVNTLFQGKARSRAISIFQIGLPLGNALGFLIAPSVLNATKSWKYTLWITPALTYGFSAIAFLIIPNFKTKKPTNIIDVEIDKDIAKNESSRWRSWKRKTIEAVKLIIKDIFFVLKQKAYLMNTFGYVFTTFATGALTTWFPTLVNYSGMLNPSFKATSETDTGLIFGVALCTCAIAGMLVGAELINWLRKYDNAIEPVICAISLLATVLPGFLAILCTNFDINITWFFAVLLILFLCLSWTPSNLITLNVIPNHFLGLANSLQIFLSHIFGDATSPVIIGSISDTVRINNTTFHHFLSLQYGLYVVPFASLLASLFYFACIYYYANIIDVNNLTEYVDAPDEQLIER